MKPRFDISRLSLLGALFACGLLAVAPTANAADAPETLPPGAKVIAIETRPPTVDLANPYSYVQLQLAARMENGDVVDVTRIAKIEVPAKLVKLAPGGLIRPEADGAGSIRVTLADKTLDIPVKITGQTAPANVSFVRDIMPLISKLGCNAGTCHGSADGKNGFKLSLRGYDPLFDIRSLTDDLEGRRFNRAAPERSLMLLKPTGGVPHSGGVVIQVGDHNYRTMKEWISGGVKPDLTAPKVASIEVYPKGPVVPVIGMKTQMAIVAKYADGTTRDVTSEAFVESSNTEVATVDKTGLVTTLRRGESTMLARYEGTYSASTVVVMGDRAGFAWDNPPAFNHIDDLVYDKLKKVRVMTSELSSDSEFIRRAYLDLTGLPPEPEVVRKFVADTRPVQVKRDEVIDSLIGSEGFIEQWTNKWADMLQVNRKWLGDVGASALRAYIRKSVAANQPYDKFAYEVMTGNGSNVENPSAAYFKILRQPDAAMENTTHLFLAIRFNCNKCHDHPFEKWTQDQYYSLTSYFAQIGRNEDPKFKGQKIGGSAVEGAVPLVELISDIKTGEVKHERTGETAKPSFPFVHAAMPKTDEARRVQLAKWITSKENPYFAKSYVNRVWSYLTGVGIIEPVDDIRAGNPATNPALLDKLTADFIASGFDTRKLIQTICKSRTYQLSVKSNKWNEGDDINYSHAMPRRLGAEVLFDSIHRVTGSTSHLPGLPAGARAAQLVDSPEALSGAFLDLFGKPVRESACECERSSGLMLGPILNLVNGSILNDALRDPNNRLAKLAAANPDDAKYVEELYMAVLNRVPTPAETASGIKALHSADGDHAAMTAGHAKRLAASQAYEKAVDARQTAWETRMLTAPKWDAFSGDKASAATKGTVLTKQADGSFLASGANGFPEVYTVDGASKLARITGVRLELLPDPSLPKNGPGRSATNGNLVLNEFKLLVAGAGKTDFKPLKFKSAKATFSQMTYDVAGAIDGNPATGWAISPQEGKANTAIFELAEPLTGAEAGLSLRILMEQSFSGKDHNIGRYRISLTGDAVPTLGAGLPEALSATLKTPIDKRTPAQVAQLVQMHRATDPELARLAGAIGTAPAADKRIMGAQDLVWALVNTPGFLFNR